MMNIKKFKQYGFFLAVPLLIFIDIISKYLIKKSFLLGESASIIGNFLRFTYVENDGMAFGILSHISPQYFWIKNTLLSIIILAVIIFLILEICREKNAWALFGFFLILGGALGNFIERIFGNVIYYSHWQFIYGQVVDFIDVGIGEYRWFFFNIADSFVSVGIAILVIRALFCKDSQKRSLF